MLSPHRVCTVPGGQMALELQLRLWLLWNTPLNVWSHVALAALNSTRGDWTLQNNSQPQPLCRAVLCNTIINSIHLHQYSNRTDPSLPLGLWLAKNTLYRELMNLFLWLQPSFIWEPERRAKGTELMLACLGLPTRPQEKTEHYFSINKA